MRNDKLIPGMVLVIIGILFLLDNFGAIDFDWFTLIRLWPILLVIAGVNLVFANNNSPAATATKIAVLIGGMAFLIVSGLGKHHDRNNWRYAFSHFDRNDNDTSDVDDIHIGDKNTGHYMELYAPTIKNAVLNISGGATSYVLKDATTNMFEADTKENGLHYTLNTSIDSATQTLDFDMNNRQGKRHGFNFNFGNRRSSKAFLKLNTNPEWDINVETGASNLDFDLTPFKLKKLTINGGVASFKVKVGQPLAETNVDISTGVSEVRLSIPKNAACHITSDTGISSKEFNGFQNLGDGEYETAGFAKATNKMYIKISGGISDFKVSQY